MTTRALVPLLSLLPMLTLLPAGCGEVSEPDTGRSSQGVQLPPGDTERVLDLVNYPGTDVDVLDRLAGLDARAARNIVAARAGRDGVSPSADDVLFQDLAALDAVPYVGEVAFQRLDAWALAHPAPRAESVEGVLFRAGSRRRWCGR